MNILAHTASEYDTTCLPDSVLIDLGTTTVAMVYYNTKTNTTFHISTFANPQIPFGKDVIARIQYDMEFSGQYTLKKVICNKLREEHNILTSANPSLTIETCIIGGNTTMIHLLMGYSLAGMTATPFRPYVQNPPFSYTYDATTVFILPWLSAFIGGDIVSGLTYLDFDSRTDTCLFADLGTNGELALCHEGTIYVTSTAAGPALEGQGLSCGCPALPGAICDITLTSRIPKTQTIHNKLPIGFCGSGAVSMLAELLQKGYLLPSGILTDKFPSAGIPVAKQTNGTEICFTRDDVRQIQLAVAAISAGIDTLCQMANLEPTQIQHFYLAGGLGYHIPVEKVYPTGLFGKVPSHHIIPMGNTCLLGLEQLLRTSDITSELSKRMDIIKSKTRKIPLGGNTHFEENFIKRLGYIEDESFSKISSSAPF